MVKKKIYIHIEAFFSEGALLFFAFSFSRDIVNYSIIVPWYEKLTLISENAGV